MVSMRSIRRFCTLLCCDSYEEGFGDCGCLTAISLQKTARKAVSWPVGNTTQVGIHCDGDVVWRCCNCGYLHTGKEAPKYVSPVILKHILSCWVKIAISVFSSSY
jgi:hypothetical protein